MADLPVTGAGLKALAHQEYGGVYSFLSEEGVPGWLAAIVAGGTTGIAMIMPTILAVVVQGILGVGSFFATSVLKVISEARSTNKDDFNAVIAESVNELLGTSVSPEQLSAGSGSASDMEANKALGDALITIFEQALGNLQPVSPAQGAENARKFAGFSVNFATSQAFLSILTEASSVGLLKEFHELPDGLMRALGLGRLQRAALAPLVRNCISQPYDLYLKQQLRPDRLADAQYVRAMARGDFDEQYVRERLAEKGFPDDEIDALIHEFTAKLQAGDLVKLIRYGEISQEDAVQQLVDQGTNKEIAEQMLKAQLLALADSRVMAYVQKIQQQRIEGWIDQAQFETMLEQVPLSDSAKEWERNLIGVIAEVPRRRISFAQLEKAVVSGHIDFTYVDEWLRAEGYSDNDQLVLTMQIIEAMQDAEAKTKAKAATHAKVSAKGKVPPPALQP